ncbi:MAG: hypothetical protein P4M09_16130 [Devosia sp.]|nr:hypothetical protein [Devosia sp.]
MVDTPATRQRVRRPRKSAAPPPDVAVAASEVVSRSKAGAAPGGKQAVIVIHGIGEQLPLETLRGFVETIYQRDPDLAGATDTDQRQLLVQRGAQPSEPLNLVWVVPDEATGSAELRRISTPANAQKIRTDFYEFYWADIMEGTPLQLAVGWIQGLLLRSPGQVPLRVRIWLAFMLLWALVLAIVAAAVFAVAPRSAVFKPVADALANWLGQWHWYLVALLAAVAIALLAQRVAAAMRWAEAKLTLPVLLAILAAALAAAPPSVLGNVGLWAWIVTFLGGLLANQLIAPYVGDVARYVRATPATVEKRKAIRDRGLQLLADIHAKVGPDGRPDYDRIVIVAHSLGCIIAYDLLQHYWEAAGPNHKRFVGEGDARRPWMPEPAVASALRLLDESVKRVWPSPDSPPVTDNFNLSAYQAAQAEVFAALSASAIQWRISDFVTLGSPLTHADFLMVDGGDALSRAFSERLYSSSPPRPDWPTPSMLYQDWSVPGRGPFPHFAAPFAAVQWTNIYDEHWFPLFGDIISGRLDPRFGPGIAQHCVEMQRLSLPPGLRRLFTHTLYWAWQKQFITTPLHIDLLRAVIGLGTATARDTHAAIGEAPPGGD